MTPACAYRVDVVLIEELDRHLGPPLDSYVRGWQVWLEDHGPSGETLEWRLHPPAAFRMPRGVNPHDLFDLVLQGLAEVAGEVDGDVPADSATFPLGDERRSLAQVWEVLEVFPTFTDDVAVDDLVAVVTDALGGRRPDAAGHVDHARLGDVWKGRRGDFSIAEALLEQLAPLPR